MKNSISIDYSPHKLWNLYKKNPPIKYRRPYFLGQFLHTFNSIRPRFFGRNIVEFEHILHLTGESRDYVRMLDGRDVLFEKLQNDKVCALIAPTKTAIDICGSYFPDFSKIEKKFHHVPAGVITKDFSEKQVNSRLNLLFIGNKFWGKGGNIAIAVTNMLNFQGIPTCLKMVCSDVPANYPIPEYVDVITTKKLDEKEKDRLYASADLFLFPVLHDSFGVHLECLEYSLPMITTDIYDKSEIIEQGVSGYLVKPPFELYGSGFGVEWKNWDAFIEHVQLCDREGGFSGIVDKMVEKITTFYDDKQKLIGFRLSMLQNTKAKFSISNRNCSVNNVYNSISR